MPAKAVIQVRRDTEADWESVNPVLAEGEIGFESDTNQIKIGDGTKTWNELQYSSGGSFKLSETEPVDPRDGDLWFRKSDNAAFIYDISEDVANRWVRLNPPLANGQVATANIADGAVTSAKLASTASVNFISNRRVFVQPGTPGAPPGNFNIGDIWISY
jgi:hypothetical protein